MASKKNGYLARQSLLRELDPTRVAKRQDIEQVAGETLVWIGQLPLPSEQRPRIDDGAVGGILQRVEELGESFVREERR